MLRSGSGWELPEGVDPWSSFHWFKVGARTGLDLVMLSSEPAWYVGHYYQSRMWPCSGSSCGLCEDGVGRQVRFVFAVVEVSSRRVGLLEVSESVGRLIRDWIPRHQGLRGMHLYFGRHSSSVKSRMEVEYADEFDVAWWADLEVPDIKVALELTWTKMKAKLPDSKDEPSRRFHPPVSRSA